jgi:hypothetical protein
MKPFVAACARASNWRLMARSKMITTLRVSWLHVTKDRAFRRKPPSAYFQVL